MMSQGVVKPQSATMPRVLGGSSRPEAISTVAAPMEMPMRNRGLSPQRRAA